MWWNILRIGAGQIADWESSQAVTAACAERGLAIFPHIKLRDSSLKPQNLELQCYLQLHLAPECNSVNSLLISGKQNEFKITMTSLRHPSLLKCPATLRPILAARFYATQTGLGTTSGTPGPRRKTVTPFNDDGRVAWGELSAGEKAARTTQQTFNFSFILLGAVLTVSCAKLY